MYVYVRFKAKTTILTVGSNQNLLKLQHEAVETHVLLFYQRN